MNKNSEPLILDLAKRVEELEARKRAEDGCFVIPGCIVVLVGGLMMLASLLR